MDQALKEKLTAKDKWLKALYILLFGIILEVIKLVTWGIAILQFVMVLVTDHPIQRLLQLSQHLGKYAAQIIHFVSYNTEQKPYPFSDWPSS